MSAEATCGKHDVSQTASDLESVCDCCPLLAGLAGELPQDVAGRSSWAKLGRRPAQGHADVDVSCCFFAERLGREGASQRGDLAVADGVCRQTVRECTAVDASRLVGDEGVSMISIHSATQAPKPSHFKAAPCPY